MEVTPTSSQDQSGITTQLWKTTQNKRLKNSQREAYSFGHTEPAMVQQYGKEYSRDSRGLAGHPLAAVTAG